MEMFGSIWRRFVRFEPPTRDSEALADGLDDMIFFERRLTEVVQGTQPKAMRWMVILVVVFVATIVSAYYWVLDPTIRYISFTESLTKHPVFATGFVSLILLFTVFGVQKRVITPKIIAARCRNVLVDFYLSCDEQGRLIVRPTHGLGGFGSPGHSASYSSLAAAHQLNNHSGSGTPTSTRSSSVDDDAERTMAEQIDAMRRQSATAAFEHLSSGGRGETP